MQKVIGITKLESTLGGNMKKISVVIIKNDNIEYFMRCIGSIIKQSYANLEILVVNTNDESIDYLNDQRIKIISTKEKLSIHDYRVLALKQCTGDYISFVDSNDYVSCDYYRSLISSAEENKADIAISSYIDINKKCIYNFINIDEIYSGEKILNTFFSTEGKNNRWYLLELKLINKNIINKILDDYKELKANSNIEDDILISILLFQRTKKLCFCNFAEYYLSRKDYWSQEISKKIFSNKIYTIYKKNVDNWSVLKKDSDYYLSKSRYNDGLEKIKNIIINGNVEVVSFDMFDTLVVRPFFRPLDLFVLMDKEFINIAGCNPVIKFSKIRIEAEEELRKNNVEVTLLQIYDYIAKFYSIDRKKVYKLKELEEKLELKFCTKRNTGYHLYSLAKYLNKKIILTSDTYFSMEEITKILKNNDYEFDCIYLSSEIMQTKNNGNLYEHIIKLEKTSNIIHIGDNLHSDIDMAKKYDLKVGYLPRTVDVMMNETNINVNNCGCLYQDFDMYNINTDVYLRNFGVRCATAVVANKYFDNPFKEFMDNTKFNSDPTFIGYFSLGMHLLALSNWLLTDTKSKQIDSLSFMARDGYLPLKAAKIFNKNTRINDNLLINYIYVSRRALMPLILSKKEAINAIDTYIDYKLFSPKTIVNQFQTIINESKIDKYRSILIDKNIAYNTNFNSRLEFYKCLSIIYDNLLDSTRYDDYLKIVRKYFDDNFVGNAATFDIGYSGKPESIISSIIGRPINTYFFHSTSSDAYNNSYISNCKLNTFYDFMPTLTGTIRELFYSDSNPSSIGYKNVNGRAVPIFADNEKYTFFNKQMLEYVQEYALKFVNDFSKLFSEYMPALDLNKFYFSIPYEYFCNYASKNDRLLFTNLIFESNVNDTNQLNYYIDMILDSYNYYNHNRSTKKLENDINKITAEIEMKTQEKLIKLGYKQLPKSRAKRILYYIMFDRKSMILKWNEWKKRRKGISRKKK